MGKLARAEAVRVARQDLFDQAGPRARHTHDEHRPRARVPATGGPGEELRIEDLRESRRALPRCFAPKADVAATPPVALPIVDEGALVVAEILARLGEREVDIGRGVVVESAALQAPPHAFHQLRIGDADAAGLHQVHECGRKTRIALQRGAEGGFGLRERSTLQVQRADAAQRFGMPGVELEHPAPGCQRLLAPAGILPGEAQRGPRPGVPRRERAERFEAFHRGLELAETLQRLAQVVARREVRRVEAQGFPILRERLGQAPELLEQVGEVASRARIVGSGLHRPREQRPRRLQVAAPALEHREVRECGGVPGIELEHATIGALRLHEVPGPMTPVRLLQRAGRARRLAPGPAFPWTAGRARHAGSTSPSARRSSPRWAS